VVAYVMRFAVARGDNSDGRVADVATRTVPGVTAAAAGLPKKKAPAMQSRAT
jgi:hypothetical protein